MSVWFDAGDELLNLNTVEYVKRSGTDMIKVYMTSGRVVEMSGNMASNIWNYFIQNRVQFLDGDVPTRDFSVT